MTGAEIAEFLSVMIDVNHCQVDEHGQNHVTLPLGDMDRLLAAYIETRAALERLLDVCRYVGPEDNPLLCHSWDYAKAEANRVIKGESG